MDKLEKLYAAICAAAIQELKSRSAFDSVSVKY
jgi:hypothetical protein